MKTFTGLGPIKCELQQYSFTNVTKMSEREIRSCGLKYGNTELQIYGEDSKVYPNLLILLLKIVGFEREYCNEIGDFFLKHFQNLQEVNKIFKMAASIVFFRNPNSDFEFP